VGVVPVVAPHYENPDNDDLIFLEMFTAPELLDVSLNLYPQVTKTHRQGHTSLTDRKIDGLSDDKTPVLMRESLGEHLTHKEM
jgi:hypothetical protein